MDLATADERVLAAADALFTERGIQAVGMDAIRETSGVSLKRLYKAFPSKNDLVTAVLLRRDEQIRAAIARHTDAAATPADKILAVFDYLDAWFREPEFRGCVFINSFAELGPTSPDVVNVVRAHKEALRVHLSAFAAAAGCPPGLAGQLVILANGAMVTAAITGTPAPARQARQAAQTLLDAVIR